MITTHGWIILAIGLIVSFLVALGVVLEWFLIWVRKHGFVPFAIYRIILGVLLLIFGADIMGELGRHIPKPPSAKVQSS